MSSGGGDGKSKYRDRYAVLQQTYEQRLQSLGERFQKALDDIHGDESLAILRQDNVSNDFVTLRVHELVAHALRDEKEHFIRTLTDKLAKKDASLKELMRDKDALTLQKKAMIDEMHQVASHVEALQARYTAMSTDTSAADAEVKRLRHENQGLIEELAARDNDRAAWDAERRRFASIEQDLARLQAVHAKDEAFYADERSKTAGQLDRLTAKVDELERTRANLTTECTALSLAVQEKTIELAHAKQSIDALKSQCASLQPLEAQLADVKAAHQATLHALELELWEARRKYTAVGEQVEGLIQDHDEERARLAASHDEGRAAAAAALRACEQREKELADAYAKQIAALEAQAREKDGVVRDTLRQLQEMEARAAASEVGRGEVKVHMTKRVAALEAEVAAVAKEGLAALEKEQLARASVEDQFGAYKRMAETKIQSLNAALQAQKDAAKRHEDAEKRMQWQDAAMKRHDALLQSMKTKYETAMAALQNEVVAARSKAAEVATEFQHKSTRHELDLMHEFQSKVAESTKQVPGQVVPLSQHKAELDKLEATLTLQLQTQHHQEKAQWEDKLQRAVDDKAAALHGEIDAWKAQVTVEKQKGDELHAALLVERKQFMDCREKLDQETSAKTLVVQRLEEANINLGRLKALVSGQQVALRQWEAKFTALRTDFDTSQGQVDALTVDLGRAKEEAAKLRGDVAAHVHTIQQLRQEGLTAQSVVSEREGAMQALLKDKTEAITYLQDMVRQANDKHADAMKAIQHDALAKEDGWTRQATEARAAITALTAESQRKSDDLVSAQATIKDHAATVTKLQEELGQCQHELAAMQLKKNQYKAALIAQRESMAAAAHAQDEWKHEVVVHETTRLHQWKSHVELLQSQVHVLKAEFDACRQSVRRALKQDVLQCCDVAVQLQGKAGGIVQTLLANAAKQLADEKAQWTVHESTRLAQVSKEHVSALTEQRQSLESDFRQQLETVQATAAQTHAELTAIIQERDAKLESMTATIHQHTTTIHSLEQRLEFHKDGGAKEVAQLRRELLEQKKVVADTQKSATAVEGGLADARSQLADVKLRTTSLCDAMTRISQAIIKPGHQASTATDWEDVVSGESMSTFRKSVQLWIDNTLHTIATNQEDAISSAVQPFKDELQRAPQVLGRRDSGELSKSVLAMAAPLAEELAASKQAVEKLVGECTQLQGSLVAVNRHRDDLEERIAQLTDENNQLQTFLDLAGQDRKAAQVHLATQLQDAYVQSEAALHQIKTASANEMDRLKRECQQAVHDLQEELDHQMRQNAKLRVALVEQEKHSKDEIQDLVRRNHLLVKATRQESQQRRAVPYDVNRPVLPRRTHASPPDRVATTSMQELSVLMESNLHASRHARHRRHNDSD